MSKGKQCYVAVVVTYNRRELLTEAIESLLQQTVSPQKILVINNAATDGTEALFEGSGRFANEPMVEQIKMSSNLGGAGGFARGVALAQKIDTDWISLSDDDAIFADDYFERLLQSADETPDVDGFAGQVILPDGRIQVDQRQIIRNWDRLKTYSVPEKDYRREMVSIDAFTFCGAFVKRALIQKIGVPDADFFIWGDDIEYSLRIRAHSQIQLVTAAKLIHKTKVPSIDFASQYQPDWREYYGLRNHVATVLSHAHSPLFGRVLLFGWMAAKYGLTLTPRFRGYRRHIQRVYWHAFGDGLRGKLGKNEHYLPKGASL